METHPVADLFPMLPDDELADLAADIKARGLLQPIVLDADGRILDGRNRYAACERAGVDPEFVTYDGDDPDGYALAVNIARRHLSKGQIAMVAARALFLKNNLAQHTVAEAVGVSRARIAYAQVILDHAPDLVDAVVSGTVPLNEAYETARQNKQGANTIESRWARLDAEAPDLADRARDAADSLTLDEAEAIVKSRIAHARAAARNLAAHINDLERLALDLRGTPTDGTLTLARRYDERLPDDDDVARAIDHADLILPALDAIAAHLKEIRDA